MITDKFRMFAILLYKNFLVRKRHWKLGLFVEILVTILIFGSITYALNNKKNSAPIGIVNVENVTYKTKYPSDYFREYRHDFLVAPNNSFTQSLVEELQGCFPSAEYAIMYPTEDHMMIDYLNNVDVIDNNRHYWPPLALIFEDENIDFTGKNVKYKIKTDNKIPTVAYEEFDYIRRNDDTFDRDITGLQLCVDQVLIRKKKNDSNFSLNINTRRMPAPAHTRVFKTQDPLFGIASGIAVCVFATAAFLIPLCIETAHASSEKFLGVNVLMSMNGVPNYLNLLSWLVSGLIFSLFYILPILLILFFVGESGKEFLQNGNFFIIWLVLTLNIGHIITFGMHVSAYFTRSLFMVTGLIVIYVGSSVFMKLAIPPDSSEVIAYLGIIFPNMLLFRAWEEIFFYENIGNGIGLNNLFQVSDRAYGTEGSVGFILIFSFIGTILNLILANYIYVINPGKYGVKKNPFYFLKFFKKMRKTVDYDKVENLEFNKMQDNSFETVSEGVFSPGIQIRNLKKMYKTSFFSKEKVHALRGISVDFYKGHITALLGHNGAGKTTMMSILSGMISSSEGLVLVNGKNVNDEIEEIMNDMGLCPQENMLFPQLSVFEQVKFFAMLKRKGNSMSVIDAEVTQLLNQLQLFDKRNNLPKELSGGQKRRACIAMAFIGDSNTLVLDEPTSGLDPESKREIWNILLKMRGKKTILISTHDMEEADVLGDRIAIMHTGQLKSYGTSMYLKKALGRGNVEVTLSIEPECDPENVRTHLDTQTEVLSEDHGKMVLSLPYNDELPDTLDKIELNKKLWGITGMSVSLITLEKVFIKVTQDDNLSESRQPFTNPSGKLEGRQLLFQTWKALICKKAVYTLKNLSTTITMFLLLLAALMCAITLSQDEASSDDPIPIRVDRYPNVDVYYKTDEHTKPYGLNYAQVTRETGATAIEKTDNSTIDEELQKIGYTSYYNFHALMAADFASDENHNILNATALFNPVMARFAQPLSINLVSNAILRNVSDDSHSIEMTAQEFPKIQDKRSYIESSFVSIVMALLVAGLLTFFLYLAVALFVIHPIRESMTNVKHLQRMTGVSCFSYWGTMLVFDLGIFFLMTVVFIGGFCIGDWFFDLRMFTWKEIFIQLGLFTLFGLNVLPIAYIFSFWKKSTSAVIKLLTLLPLALVLIDIIMSLAAYFLQAPLWHDSPFHTVRRIEKGLLLFTPYVSFFQGQVAFFNSSKINGGCAKLADYDNFGTICDSGKYNDVPSLCCDMKCNGYTCTEAVPYFLGFQNDISLSMSFLALGLTTILWFGVLLILEFQLFERLFAKFRGGIPDNSDDGFEEQVKKVKHDIAYEVCKAKNEYNGSTTGKFQTIPEIITENGQTEQMLRNDRESKGYVFFVYELRKLYGLIKRFVAVQDVSFGVNESECFGLLGVNGAGKTTTFKMMTEEIIPDHGIIHLSDKSGRGNKNYLKQIGYCPQNDAIIRSLNAYDHLRLFARLRGIPEEKIEQEVKKWIDRLNLNVCAQQPSGTYSGGNKRRLNIAMALIGIPNLVLLDEPTTGVDPAARRSLWNTIQSCQATGQAVILTSHSMEECEALCNKLAIMVDGKFVCIGPSEELKQRFGAGYDIQLKLTPMKPDDEIEKIKQELNEALPGEAVDENSGSLFYHVSSTNVTWRQMYNVMNDLKTRYSSIEDFSVLSSTLEQLFLLFAKAAQH